MNRRQFAKLMGAGALALRVSETSSSLASAQPEISITMDDPNSYQRPRLNAEERNLAILDALRSHAIRAALFVCGQRVDTETGRRLVGAWDKAGHLIGNHSYSHLYYHGNGFEKFSEDALRGEAVISHLSRFRKIFRFPFLKEGDTPEKRDRMRAFLKERGYSAGHVTIDASDWYVDDRLRARITKEPNADLTPYKKFYLDHLWDRALFYDDLSRKALGRSVKHTLLIHHNLLSALFLKDALEMFKRKGWKLIDAEVAFADPVFSAEPKIAPAGESIIWAVAKETKKFDDLLRYPGEDGEYEKPKMDRLGL